MATVFPSLSLGALEGPITSLVLLADDKGQIERRFKVHLQEGVNHLKIDGLSNNTDATSTKLTVSQAPDVVVGDIAFVRDANQQSHGSGTSTTASGQLSVKITAQKPTAALLELTYVSGPIFWIPEYEIHDGHAYTPLSGGYGAGLPNGFRFRYSANIFQFTGEIWPDLSSQTKVTIASYRPTDTQRLSSRTGALDLRLRMAGIQGKEDAIIRAQNSLAWAVGEYDRQYSYELRAQRAREMGHTHLPSAAPFRPHLCVLPPLPPDCSPTSFAARRPPPKYPTYVLHSLPKEDRHTIAPQSSVRPPTLNPEQQVAPKNPSPKADVLQLTSQPTEALVRERQELMLRADAPNVTVAEILDVDAVLRITNDVASSSSAPNLLGTTVRRDLSVTLQVKNPGPFNIIPGPLIFSLKHLNVDLGSDLFAEHIPVGGTFSFSIPRPHEKGVSTFATQVHSIPQAIQPNEDAQASNDPNYQNFSRIYTTRSILTNDGPFPALFELVEDGMAVFNILIETLSHDLPPFPGKPIGDSDSGENGVLHLSLDTPSQAFEAESREIDVSEQFSGSGSGAPSTQVRALWRSKMVHLDNRRLVPMKVPPRRAADLRKLFWTVLPLSSPGLHWKVSLGPKERFEIVSVWRLTDCVHKALLG